MVRLVGPGAAAVLRLQPLICLQVTDPDEQTIINDKVVVGAKLKELEHKVERRGLYTLCYELHEGTDSDQCDMITLSCVSYDP